MLIPIEIDFAECGRELVHTPGSVQSLGVMLVADDATRRVELVSENCRRCLGVSAGELLGADVTQAFDRESALRLHSCLNTLTEATAVLVPALLRPTSGQRSLAARVHRFDGRLILELEPADVPPTPEAPLADDLEVQLGAARNIHEVSRIATAEARRLTGFDRVMVYRLLGSLGGEVVAEERSGLMTSLLGIRFPPHDYPPQAQRLQMLLGTRVVADVQSPQAMMVTTTSSALPRPVDMSYSHLRGVSAFCLQYLKEIGVATSVTAAIPINGTLWGFISLHNARAAVVPWPVRLALQTLGVRVAAHILRLEASRRDWEAARRTRRADAVRARAAQAGETLLAAIIVEPPRLMDMLGAGGIALVHGAAMCRRGQAPGTEAVRDLVTWVVAESQRTNSRLIYSDTLSNRYPPATAFLQQASGLLALVLDAETKSVLLLFRPELRRDVIWGGDPTRPVRQDELKRLHPRSTFERWRQEVTGVARSWTEDDLDFVAELRDLVVAQAERLGLTAADLAQAALHAFRRKLDERAFLREEMLAAVSEGMALTANIAANGETRTIGANNRLCDIFDLDPTELLGTPVSVALDRIGLPPDILTSTSDEVREFDLWSESIGLRSMRVSTETIAEACGDETGHRLVLLRFQDVTEFRRTVAAMATMRDQQQAANESRVRFLAGLGHELRSPLNAIMGFAEAIKAELMGPVGNDIYRAYADDIRHSGKHLLHLISDLLDLSKIEAGKRLVASEVCDLGGIVTEVFRWTKMQFEKKMQVWQLDIPQGSILMTGDQSALRQVVINLLGNAGKFTPAGGRVICRLVAPENDDLVLTIEDSGTGIAPEEIEAVFQPFMRSKAAHTIDHTGSGLGLSISRGLIELHEGRIEINSDGRTGTLVRMILPAYRRLTLQQATDLMLGGSNLPGPAS